MIGVRKHVYEVKKNHARVTCIPIEVSAYCLLSSNNVFISLQIVRSTFVMKCSISKSGWSTTVIGCKTAHGVVVKPGDTITEADTVGFFLTSF